MLGDIWVLGEHRIGCGDGRDVDFLRRVVGEGAQIDAAFLDPPYNVKINGHANANGRHREFAMASGEMSEAAFRTFLAETLGACAAVSRDGAVHFVCMDWRHMDDCRRVWPPRSMATFSTSASGTRATPAWARSTAPSTRWCSSTASARRRTSMRSSSAGTAATAPTSGTMRRSTRWPAAGARTWRCIRPSSRSRWSPMHSRTSPGAAISCFDMFLGSGTTLIAAERIGRTFPRLRHRSCLCRCRRRPLGRR